MSWSKFCFRFFVAKGPQSKIHYVILHETQIFDVFESKMKIIKETKNGGKIC